MGSVVEKYKEIDEKLREHKKFSTGVLKLLEPVNLAEEKERFMRTGEEPKFKYPFVLFNPRDTIKRLCELKVPEGELHEVYANKIEELINLAHIVLHRGERNEVLEYSTKVYGKPSLALVREALNIMKNTVGKKPSPTRHGKKYDCRYAKTLFEETIRNYGIEGWVVELSRKSLVTVMPLEKEVLVPYGREFTTHELRRLVVHEVGVHVLRAENGHNQPLHIFASGFPNNTETEEGLAVYMEKATRLLERERLRNYAGRVVAVDMVVRGHTFSETFSKLKELGFNDDDAFTLTFRAFRGGAFTKDYLYLKGLLEIERIAKRRGVLKLLYLGRVTHPYLETLQNLLENREVKAPVYMPKGMRNLTRAENLLKHAETLIRRAIRRSVKSMPEFPKLEVIDGEVGRKIAHDLRAALRKWRAALRARV